MDINKLLRGTDCSCGRRHTCDIDAVYIENGAVSHLAELCGDAKGILIVADENTFGAAGDLTAAALSGKSVKKVVFPGSKILVPDEQAISAVENELAGVDMIVGVGSGVIQDLCKYVSFDKKIPYAVVATAPSMDGYASDGAAMILGGMKVTCHAGLPRAILADPAVLAAAPIDMIKAGYGDVIGKFSALNDWKLSHCVNGEYFCREIYDMTFEQVNNTLQLADSILKRSEKSVAALMEALVVIGILMSFAGSSRPASGSEHHLSHFFEITGIIEGKEYFPHGIDVAYSTVITAGLREKILNSEFPKSIFRLPRPELEKEIKRIYGPVAEGCIELQDKVGNYAADRASVYLAKEEEIRSILSEMPTVREITDMLELAELNINDFYALYGKEKINDAVLYAKELKDRYTVLWVNYDFFGGENNNG